MIIDRTGKVAKSHSGVRSEFGRLSQNTPGLDRTFSTFLAKVYGYKEINDYRVGEGVTVSEAQAHDAIEQATRLVDRIAQILAQS